MLNKILEEYRDNWDALAIELEKIREAIKRGRESEETFGFEPKKEMPFFGLLKCEIYGKKPIETLRDEDVDLLVELTRDAIEIIRRETQVVDFWESYPKQKRLKSFLISRLLKPVPSHLPSPKKEYMAKESHAPYIAGANKVLFGKRNEIAQKLMELAYHIYGK